MKDGAGGKVRADEFGRVSGGQGLFSAAEDTLFYIAGQGRFVEDANSARGYRGVAWKRLGGERHYSDSGGQRMVIDGLGAIMQDKKTQDNVIALFFVSTFLSGLRGSNRRWQRTSTILGLFYGNIL